MGLKSRNKGKVGERQAVKFLRGIGFLDAERTQQYSGRGDSDVVCPETLSDVHLEVKFGYERTKFDIGSAEWLAALERAQSDAGLNERWAVLWRPKRCSEWRLTFFAHEPQAIATVSGADGISEALRWLQGAPRVEEITEEHFEEGN